MSKFELKSDGCVYELSDGKWTRWGDYGLWMAIYNIELQLKEDINEIK